MVKRTLDLGFAPLAPLVGAGFSPGSATGGNAFLPQYLATLGVAASRWTSATGKATKVVHPHSSGMLSSAKLAPGGRSLRLLMRIPEGSQGSSIPGGNRSYPHPEGGDRRLGQDFPEEILIRAVESPPGGSGFSEGKSYSNHAGKETQVLTRIPSESGA